MISEFPSLFDGGGGGWGWGWTNAVSPHLNPPPQGGGGHNLEVSHESK
jgi:hypothetical protein